MPSGRDYQLPRGDRDVEDRRSERPARDLDTAPAVPPRAGRGFVEYLDALSKDPAVVPVYACYECDRDFNWEPTTDGGHHPEEAKRKGLTWCSVRCLENSRVRQAS